MKRLIASFWRDRCSLRAAVEHRPGECEHEDRDQRGMAGADRLGRRESTRRQNQTVHELIGRDIIVREPIGPDIIVRELIGLDIIAQELVGQETGPEAVVQQSIVRAVAEAIVRALAAVEAIVRVEVVAIVAEVGATVRRWGQPWRRWGQPWRRWQSVELVGSGRGAQRNAEALRGWRELNASWINSRFAYCYAARLLCSNVCFWQSLSG